MSELSRAAKPSLCFVAFDAVSLIFPDALGSIGGAETQVVLMARALAADPDVRVVVVVRDSRARPNQFVHGFEVVTKVDRLFRIRRFVSEHVTVSKSAPWIRIKKWHARLIWQIPLLFLARFFRKPSDASDDFDWLVDATNCEVYCCMGVSDRTAQVFEAVQQQHRKAVLFVVSDADLDERYISVSGFISQHGDSGDRCAEAIRVADLIACQTNVQHKMLAERFARESVAFPNPFDHEDWAEKIRAPLAMAVGIPSRFALWIGRSDHHHKRPHLLLQVARKCPSVRFVMVMNTHDESVAVDIRRHCPPNVVIIERVPFQLIPQYFRRAAMFISTGSSEFEGFPNVFLQAAATAIPIVSLEADPDFIARHRTGVVCDGDVDQLASVVQELWADAEKSEELGNNGPDYVRTNHSSADARQRLMSILESVL